MAISPSTRYPGQTSTADLVGYPEGAAKDVGASGDGTGTPWQADLVNDLFGFQQALLAEVGESPTGIPDKVGASQYLDAIKTLILQAERRSNRDLTLTALAQAESVDILGGGDSANVVLGGDTFSDGAAVLAGESGKISTSRDALTWTPRTAAGGFTGAFRGGVSASAGAILVLVGDSGEIQVSTNNGGTWATIAPAGSYGGDFYGCAIDNTGTYVVIGSANEIQSSVNPSVAWVSRTSPLPATTRLEHVLWTGERFVAIGFDTATGDTWRTAYSEDGESWTQGADITGDLLDAEVGDGVVYAGLVGGLAFSDDGGETWSTFAITGHRNEAALSIDAIGFYNGVWVLAAYNATATETEFLAFASGAPLLSTGAAPATASRSLDLAFVAGRWVGAGVSGFATTSTHSGRPSL